MTPSYEFKQAGVIAGVMGRRHPLGCDTGFTGMSLFTWLQHFRSCLVTVHNTCEVSTERLIDKLERERRFYLISIKRRLHDQIFL